ncbi:MAG: pilus assembly protein TadG-related protein [Desulfobacterales bacterium]|jgi:hypothetical protein
MKPNFFFCLNDQHGVSAVIIAICLLILVGFVALAIDVGHLYVAKNELQNAADAGALAGAMNLFTEDMTSINEAANQIAYDAAVANLADKYPVELKDHLSNNGDVQRGHWSVKNRTFTPNASTVVVPLLGRSQDELDDDTDFINAVRVVTRRESTPIASFFATIFGRMGFLGVTDAVAYRGFAGTESTLDIDQPIAICAQSVIKPGGEYPEPFDPSLPPPENPCLEDGDISDCEIACNTGKMLDSGTDKGQPTSTHNTAAWINYTSGEDPSACSTASASDMNQLVCKTEAELPDWASKDLKVGNYVGSTGGVQQSTFDKMRACWQGGSNCEAEIIQETGECTEDQVPIDSENDEDDIPEKAWKLKLPVVDCPGNNVSTCSKIVGVVCIQLIWMTSAGTPDPSLETPFKMTAEVVPENGEALESRTWDVTDDNSSVELADGQTSFTFLESWDGLPFPSKYFEPQPISCGEEPGPLPAIPAPLTRSEDDTVLPSLPGGGGWAADPRPNKKQYLITKDFLKIEDPGTPPYNPNNICSDDELRDAFWHRQADAAGMGRWYSFTSTFGLRNYDGKLADLAKKSIYYTADCDCEKTGRGGGGPNFGVLAKYPVLVE